MTKNCFSGLFTSSSRLPTAIVKEIDHLRIEADVSRNKLIEEAVNDLLKKYNNHKASGTVDK